MYTPSELREKAIKTGLKIDKRDAEQFFNEISSYILKLQQENEDLKKTVKDLTDSISYYKSIEKTLQKALVLAEKTAQDIKAAAHKEAETIEEDARNKARKIQLEAANKLMLLEQKTLNLIHQYDIFRTQFTNLLNSQLELLNNQSFQINTDDFLHHEDKPENESGNNSQDDSGNNPEIDTEDVFSESETDAGQTSDSAQALDDGFEIIHVLDDDI